ncbi:pilus assembly protein [Tabrizicola sp. J26]|uniref:Flp family type IVb pilin n=1 Tax=Alitabrizicola rongguiensis TaxID=2909234 RepID=UPI001F213D1A|nr:pilus assembly protein [Tabrizicola rongguiensis]MCF1707281.1 pilus assembly protein [Tabrizicola rongguiensis]
MIKVLTAFRRDEDGAVTVDWVVLTASIVGLGLAVLTAINGGLTTAMATLITNLGTIHTVFNW